jgi:two-component system, sensor histidine kinase YesM
MIVALSALLRSSIADPGKLLSLREEADLLGQYVLIQKMRLAERLDCSVRIAAELERVLIPRLTLQPLVENSINHCLESMMDVCRVEVRAAACDGTAVISVIDNGPGIPAERIGVILRAGEGEPGRSTGLGMANIDERIKIIFGRRYGLRIARGRRSGARVDVRIPLVFDGTVRRAAP